MWIILYSNYIIILIIFSTLSIYKDQEQVLANLFRHILKNCSFWPEPFLIRPFCSLLSICLQIFRYTFHFVFLNRAAFKCGREPNFELTVEEKDKLSKMSWDDFLTMTRSAINSKSNLTSSYLHPLEWLTIWIIFTFYRKHSYLYLISSFLQLSQTSWFKKSTTL